MVYIWQFALGSFINVVWKDAISGFNRDVNTNYFKNFGNTLRSDQQNSISIRVIYFLDYLNLKKKRSWLSIVNGELSIRNHEIDNSPFTSPYLSFMSKKLFLLDAMALIYRAYYALIRNPRITSKGRNTNAQFGFTNTLFDLIK